MATNKHAMIRYQALDKCFRNPGRRYFMDDLVMACNDALYEYSGGDSTVKRRQIFEDIKYMESPQGWNIPLLKEKDGRKVYYRYEDINFSINNQLLNEREELQLQEALNTLSRFKGMPQFEWIDELTAKLKQGLKLDKRKEKIIEFEQNQYLKGLEFITPLYEAIQNLDAVNVEYQSFKKESSVRIELSPYFLKQYNNRWFLFGTATGFDNLTNLALDRIRSIKPSDTEFRTNNKIDFEEYFEDVIGVTVTNDDEKKIKLKISDTLWPYIKNKPIHGSQKRLKEEETSDENKVIQLNLKINYELKSLIFSHMDAIEVLEPVELREEIATIAKHTKSLYD